MLFKILLLVLIPTVTFSLQSLRADLVLNGYHHVDHRIVFVESDLLNENRLIATPAAGFSGITEVKPGVEFSFSIKYGTRFYVVPNGEVISASDFPGLKRKGALPEYPSCDPPLHEINQVPNNDPIYSALTTCKLTKVCEQTLQIEVVEHVERDRIGNQLSKEQRTAATKRKSLLKVGGLVLLSLIGFLGIVYIWRSNFKRKDTHSQD